MRAAVTGGAGFLGSHLVDKLLDLGHTVTVFDNLSTGREENIEIHSSNPRFTFKYMDISFDEPDFYEHDVVFHLAALADIVPSITDPVSYYEANVQGTLNVIEAARKDKVKKLIYTASSSCYGIPKRYPTIESDECDPKYPYALTKYLGEQMILHWSKVYKIPALSLRLFNVYGPRARTNGTYGAVFGTFLAQMANNEPITIVGDGKQTRDFVYVTDVVNAVILAAESDHSGHVINIGSQAPKSINTLADLLGAKKRVHLPKRPGEPDETYAATGKAKKLLNWEPRISFEKGCAVMKTLIPAFKDAPVWTPDKIEQATKEWFLHL